MNLRDRSSTSSTNSAYHTTAKQESQTQTGQQCYVTHIQNNPQITINNTNDNVPQKNNPQTNPTTTTIGQDKWSNKYTMMIILLIILIVAGFIYHVFNLKPDTTKTTQEGIETIKATTTSVSRTVIAIENAETIIATKLTEIVDMYTFAACLKIKNSKAIVEQSNKNYRGKVEDVRIEIVDIWFKAADKRYWEDLIIILQECMLNERLASQLAKEYLD